MEKGLRVQLLCGLRLAWHGVVSWGMSAVGGCKYLAMQGSCDWKFDPEGFVIKCGSKLRQVGAV
jgi:hypothetical protein